MPKPGGTVDRGYGPGHRAARKHWQPIIDAGNGYCCEPICYMPTRWIPPGSRWDLAHTTDKQGYRGPAHPKCNRTEGAKRGYIAQQKSYARAQILRRRW